MSYYRIFAPPKEMIDKLQQKAKRARSYNNDSTEIELRTYCMLDHTNDKIGEVIEKIRLLLNMLSYDAISMSYKYAVDRYEEDGDHEVYFCGYEYSRTYPETTIGESYRHVLPKLVTLCCAVKTPDWYEDSEKFYDKEYEIDSLIEYFIEISSLNGDYEIIDMLKEWEVKDSDGCDGLQEETEEKTMGPDNLNGEVTVSPETGTIAVTSTDVPTYDDTTTISTKENVVYTTDGVH